MNNTKSIQSENYVEGLRGWKIEGGNIEINPALFMVGIAYDYHSPEDENLAEFVDRLMTKYGLDKPVDLESKLCEITHRDEILIPGKSDPEALNRLREVVEKLAI